MEIKKLNESLGYISSNSDEIINTIYKELSFYVSGYKFIPSYKSGHWDGQIHLFDRKSKTFPLGLVSHIISLREKYPNLEIALSTDVEKSFNDESVKEQDIRDFIEGNKYYSKGQEIFPREDQIEATTRSILKKRCINLCPTSFGKSLSITLECLWYIQRGMKCLIIVPTKDLVLQFNNDIRDYATNKNGFRESWYPVVQLLYAGKDKKIYPNTNITISTWQTLKTIYDKDNEFMNQFDVIINDECQRAKGNIIRTLMMSATECQFRTGWTGTLANGEVDELIIKGLFGEEKKIITTKELMDKEIVANLKIIALKLRYPSELCKEALLLEWANHCKYIESCVVRTKRLLRILKTQENTGLVFYRKIKHGEEIFSYAKEMFPDRTIYLIHSGHYQMNDIMFKSFEEIKEHIEKDKNGIVIANYGMASTGVSVKNLHYIMFFVGVKSYIQTLQSIGRGLRISNTKNKVILFDVADDFTPMTGKIPRKIMSKNFSFKHFIERISMYNEQEFTYNIVEIPLQF